MDSLLYYKTQARICPTTLELAGFLVILLNLGIWSINFNAKISNIHQKSPLIRYQRACIIYKGLLKRSVTQVVQIYRCENPQLLDVFLSEYSSQKAPYAPLAH